MDSVGAGASAARDRARVVRERARGAGDGALGARDRAWGRLSPGARRALRDGPIVAGLLFLVYLFVDVAPKAGTVGFDALSYWIYSIDDPYAITHGTMGSFVYSPVAARLFQLDSLLPFWQFLFLWEALLVGTVLWLGGRKWWLALLAFPPVALELYHGNIHLLIAAAIALGFRYPAAWAFVLLTKVTPGVGLLWFAVRREWRSLGIALGATAALVAVSLVVDFRLWIDWWEQQLAVSLAQPPNQPQIAIPLVVRLALAAAIVVAGALTNRKWTVPLAAAVAMPVLWIAAFAVLAALPAVGRKELRSREEEAADLAHEARAREAGAATEARFGDGPGDRPAISKAPEAAGNPS